MTISSSVLHGRQCQQLQQGMVPQHQYQMKYGMVLICVIWGFLLGLGNLMSVSQPNRSQAYQCGREQNILYSIFLLFAIHHDPDPSYQCERYFMVSVSLSATQIQGYAYHQLQSSEKEAFRGILDMSFQKHQSDHHERRPKQLSNLNICLTVHGWFLWRQSGHLPQLEGFLLRLNPQQFRSLCYSVSVVKNLKYEGYQCEFQSASLLRLRKRPHDHSP